jgi:hypothetical protein
VPGLQDERPARNAQHDRTFDQFRSDARHSVGQTGAALDQPRRRCAVSAQRLAGATSASGRRGDSVEQRSSNSGRGFVHAINRIYYLLLPNQTFFNSVPTFAVHFSIFWYFSEMLRLAVARRSSSMFPEKFKMFAF